MQAVCPITDKRIDEHVSRINAFITVLLVLSFIFFHFWGGMAFLTVDFMIRGFFDSKYSPVCLYSKWIVNTFNLNGKVINAGPKIFAAQVGMALSVISLAFFFKGCNTVCIAAASLLGVFSFLESVFGYCVACKLYPIFRKTD
jgi:hypothetical protein